MTRMRAVNFILLIVVLFFAAPAMAANSGFAVRNTKIMEAPFKDAKVVGPLNKGATVEIVKRKGGWLQISAGKSKGWVRMMTVRRGKPGEKASSGTEAGGVLGLASGRAGSGNVVASTGVRGLSEEELKEAEFDGNQIQKLESFTASNSDAKGFAKEAELKKQSVDFLAAPQKK